jgi:hypothetical protein
MYLTTVSSIFCLLINATGVASSFYLRPHTRDSQVQDANFKRITLIHTQIEWIIDNKEVGLWENKVYCMRGKRYGESMARWQLAKGVEMADAGKRKQ